MATSHQDIIDCATKIFLSCKKKLQRDILAIVVCPPNETMGTYSMATKEILFETWDRKTLQPQTIEDRFQKLSKLKTEVTNEYYFDMMPERKFIVRQNLRDHSKHYLVTELTSNDIVTTCRLLCFVLIDTELLILIGASLETGDRITESIPISTLLLLKSYFS